MPSRIPILFTLLAAPLTAQAPAEAAVRAIDSVWARNYAINDTATALQLMSDDFFMTSSNGSTKDKAAEMRDIRATPGLKMHYFRTSNVSVRLHATAAVVNGLAEWSYDQNGRTANSSRFYTAVYARGGPLGWRLVVLNMRTAPLEKSAEARLRAEADTLMAAMVAAFKRDPASTARFYTDDARMVGGGMRTVGRQQINGYWSGVTGFRNWTLQVLAVGGEPNAPWAVGRSVLEGQDGRKMTTEFIGVLKRGADGRLQFYLDMYAAAPG
jgi:ketosteroid isomerase-like protein